MSTSPSPERQPLPISTSLAFLTEAMQSSGSPKSMDRRTLFLGTLALGIGIVAAVLAQLLQMLIGLITHLAFYGDVGWSLVSPAHHALGPWVVAIPVIGALVIGFMARYGSPAIRGHGIPEAME